MKKSIHPKYSFVTFDVLFLGAIIISLLFYPKQTFAFDCDHVDLDIPQVQCQVLMVAYDSMGVLGSGVHTSIKSQWVSETDFTICDANFGDRGFFCQNNLLVNVSLNNYSLTGSIPAEFALLTDTTKLVLSGNQFSGALPADLSLMPQLKQLELGDNSYSGAIPVEWSGFQNLEHLYLEDNQLSILTPELSQVSTLKTLSLKGNLFVGQIPAEYGSFANLRSLRLYDNQLTGSIPAEIGALSTLNRLDLSNNLLSGEIPAELAGLNNLTGLFLQNNELSGRIPESLGLMANLNELRLNDNDLYGAVPDLSATAVPEIAGRVRIQNNCLSPFPETAQAVVDWLALRVTSGSSGSGLANQRTRANCFTEVDLISQSGFEIGFGGNQILSVDSEDLEPEHFGTDGQFMVLFGNSWKAVAYPYVVTSETTLRFDFQALTAEAEINGVGLTRDISGVLPVPEQQAFQVFGTELWTDNQIGGGYQINDYVTLCVPVGSYFTGAIHYMVFVNDDDGGTVNNQWAAYSNYSLSQDPCPL